MRFGRTAKVLAKCKLKYCGISECMSSLPEHDMFACTCICTHGRRTFCSHAPVCVLMRSSSASKAHHSA